MFNIHSTEILLICIVALVVIGPEKLPSAIKTASLWIGRFRRSFYKVKSEIERELNADEIRRQLHNESVLDEIEDAKSSMEKIAKDTEKSVNNIVNSKTFDPGAAKASQEESDAVNSLQDEVAEIGEEIEQVAKQLYSTGKNPRLQDDASKAEADESPLVEKPIVDKPIAETPLVETSATETPLVETPADKTEVATEKKTNDIA